MCAGYTSCKNDTNTSWNKRIIHFLSKLPGANKKLVHYVAVAEYEDDNLQTHYVVIDPERESNCEKKRNSFFKL